MSPQFIASLITLLVTVGVILPSVAYLILLERKIAAWVQDRIGPNRTGFSFGILPLDFHFWGLGQPLADGLKLLLKEPYIPAYVDRGLFLLGPILSIVPAMIAWAVMPWGGYLRWGDSLLQITAAPIDIGVAFILAAGSMAVYGVVVGGYASNNKYSFLGSVRAAAQIVSYEVPLSLCVLTMILLAGTLRADLIVLAQANSVWNIFYMPLLAIIFFTCTLAESNRAPFDLPEAEQELVLGYHTEYNSMNFAMYFLGEYMHVITVSAFFVLLFLGGWDLPIVREPAAGGLFLVAVKCTVFAAKTFVLVAFVMLVRWTLPRLRFDQLMGLAWRVLVPAALTLLLWTAVVIFRGWPWWTLTAGNIALLALGILLAALVPQPASQNRRLPLPGSRFSPA